METRDESSRALLEELVTEDPDTRLAAANALAERRDDASLSALVGLVRTHPDPVVRYDAAYALAFRGNPEALPALLESATDLAEIDRVRGQAIEGVGNLLAGADRRRKEFKDAAGALLPLLEDPWPEVRFWTAFALGHMRATAAVPALERLAAEDGEPAAKGWGWATVGEEAKAALACIHTGHFPFPED